MKHSFYENKTIVITGGAGSLGTELCLQLLNFNIKKIVVLDQSESAIHYFKLKFREHNSNNRLKIELADVRCFEHLNSIFSKHKPNIVFHAAALKQLPVLEDFPSEAVLTNVLGTMNILKLVHKFYVQNFMFISTDKAVEPSSIMGISKYLAEMYINNIEIERAICSIIRFGNVYNSNGSAIEIFKQQIKSGGPVTITDKRVERFFISIEKACKSIIDACSISRGGETFIIKMGSPQKILDIIHRLIKEEPLAINSIEIEEIGLRKGEKLKEKLLEGNQKLEKSNIEGIHFFVSNEEYSEAFMNHLELLIGHASMRNEQKVLDYFKIISDLNSTGQ